MVAADAVYEHFVSGLLVSGNEVCGYADLLKKSWLWKELYRARNIRPAFRYGLWAGVAYSALDTYLLRGRAPWTFGHIADHSVLRNSNLSPPISYPKPDGYLTFDRLTSVFFSAINHAENQRCHLQLRDVEVPIKINYTRYAVPEVRYCPAGVYEVVDVGESKINLQINSQNCLHCKACDIKDPTQNICWTVPEGGSGPCYPNM
jgi:electron-transferring-flavoprotein dehydrogenase